jgi:ABC-type proline/glycine betaine transport system ATPase subunit
LHVVPNPKKIIQLNGSGKQGRYVRIQLLDKNYLSLAEVQVRMEYGYVLDCVACFPKAKLISPIPTAITTVAAS